MNDKKKRILSIKNYFKESLNKCLNNEIKDEDLKLKLFASYLNFLNELYFNGFYFLNTFKECVSIEVEMIEEIMDNINNYNLPLHLEVYLTRYYILFKFFPNFKIDQSYDILQNMFFSNSEFFHKYNEKYEKQYTFTQFQNILCNPNFIINNDYRKYEEHYILKEIKSDDNQEDSEPKTPQKNFDYKKVNFEDIFNIYKTNNQNDKKKTRHHNT